MFCILKFLIHNTTLEIFISRIKHESHAGVFCLHGYNSSSGDVVADEWRGGVAVCAMLL